MNVAEQPSPPTAVLGPALCSDHYPAVRRRVFRQLLESLLYEGVLTARPVGDEYQIDGVDEDGAAVGYRFRMRRAYGFDRVRLGPEPVWRHGSGEPAEADSLTRFLTETADRLGAAPGRIAGFGRELEETLVKDTVAQFVRAERSDVLQDKDFDQLEGAVMDGHPYHPAYKSRLGFDQADNLRWGPEFARPIRPIWVAVRRELAHVTASATVTEPDLLRRALGDTLGRFRRLLARHRVDPDDYALLPVHPWQWQRTIPSGFAAALHRKDVIALGPDPADHVAQQSIRTLSCPDEPERANVKLALSIVNTSTSRVLAPHTVRNAPAISDWLRGLVDADPFLRDELRVILLGEIFGVVADPPPVTVSTRLDTYGTLACIWRESLPPRLDPAERAVPFTALTTRELDGTPFVDAWIRAHGLREWVAELLAVSLTPLLHLLQGHGVALESHAQNLALVHVDGRPARLALRDFHDGIRFSRTHLAAPDRCPPLHGTPACHGNRNSFVETDDVDAVTDFLLDACCFVNLAELAMFLDDHYGLPEADFWAEAGAVLDRYHARFPELADRFALFDVTKPRLDVEQLTTRRLLPDTELRLHSVPNPLHRAAPDTVAAQGKEQHAPA